eukprot:6479584-Amphidinium_carterae.1
MDTIGIDWILHGCNNIETTGLAYMTGGNILENRKSSKVAGLKRQSFRSRCILNLPSRKHLEVRRPSLDLVRKLATDILSSLVSRLTYSEPSINH